MNSGADGLVRRLAQSAAKSEEIDIWRTLGDMTMAVVGSASFGQALSPIRKWLSCLYSSVVVVDMHDYYRKEHGRSGLGRKMTAAVEGCPAIPWWMDLGPGKLEGSANTNQRVPRVQGGFQNTERQQREQRRGQGTRACCSDNLSAGRWDSKLASNYETQ